MKERRKEGIGRDASLLGGEKGEEKRRNLPLLLLGTHARVQKREERSKREEEEEGGEKKNRGEEWWHTTPIATKARHHGIGGADTR